MITIGIIDDHGIVLQGVSNIFAAKKEYKVEFEMIEKGIARHGYDIKDFDGQIIGSVTSGTQSPSLAL